MTTSQIDPDLVTLCDDNGAAVGTAVKTAVHSANTPLHLAFSVYLFDADARVLVTRRASSKAVFPGIRTNSCCGHPAPGESMSHAVVRRVGFELGAIPTQVELMLPAFRYRAVAADGTVENELCPVYRAMVTDMPVVPAPAEVAAAWWVQWADFARDVVTSGNADPFSAWSQQQVAQLTALGPDPLSWPVADPALLPAAAR